MEISVAFPAKYKAVPSPSLIKAFMLRSLKLLGTAGAVKFTVNVVDPIAPPASVTCSVNVPVPSAVESLFVTLPLDITKLPLPLCEVIEYVKPTVD